MGGGGGVARTVNRGEIWSYRFKAPDKRRPVLVLSRQDVIRLLHTVIVAPVTSTLHGVPSEVLIGLDEGLKQDSVVNLDHLYVVEQARLVGYIGTVPLSKMRLVCRALTVATGCAE